MIKISKDEFVYLYKNKLLGSYIIINKGKKSKNKKHFVGNENMYIVSWLRKNKFKTNNYTIDPPLYMKDKPQIVKALGVKSITSNCLIQK